MNAARLIEMFRSSVVVTLVLGIWMLTKTLALAWVVTQTGHASVPMLVATLVLPVVASLVLRKVAQRRKAKPAATPEAAARPPPASTFRAASAGPA